MGVVSVSIQNVSVAQGRRLRGDRRGSPPLKYLGGGDGGAFIPPMFRKCHCKLSQLLSLVLATKNDEMYEYLY